MSLNASLGACGAVELPVLIFDGDCGFCSTAARFAQRRVGLTSVAAWQQINLDRVGLDEALVRAAVHWVDEQGGAVAGADAIAAALEHRGGPWGAAGRLLMLPGIHAAASGMYRLVARYRYRLPGGSPTCHLPR